MTVAIGAAGAISLLLDVLPILACIFLGVSFIRNRKAAREEERELRRVIEDFSEEITDEQSTR